MAALPNDASVLLSSTLTPTQSFHTTSTTRIALRGTRARGCGLRLHFALPAQLFADPFELQHRAAAYTFERFGTGNLEAPVFAPGAGGPSALLLDVTSPEGETEIEVEVPLHARYGVPKSSGDMLDEVMLLPPEAFWACPRDDDEPKSVPQALRAVVNLVPALKDASVLMRIPHAEAVRAQTLRVPVGDARDVEFVETGTIMVIVVLFVYLLRALIRASRAGDAMHVSTAKKTN
ncbi:PIG-X [Gloeopeniophorella convolvens]|nr:PIG-X [Gloeopeniophorella convolvens]